MITKKDVKDIVQKTVTEATDTILNGVQIMFDEQNKINDKKFAKQSNFGVLNQKIDTLTANVHELRDQVKGIKADISTTPTREEFNQLKLKVNKIALT